MTHSVCIFGDCREIMRRWVGEGVRAQMCVTSPPYWGLRDYGVAGQLGLERTPEEYVANMVEVFRLVREVLADDGTLWLNLGDCYNAYNGGSGPSSKIDHPLNGRNAQKPALASGFGLRSKGLKPKDLVGIPWRVAFALQADGWYLRSDIIWAKPNPMPESVTDRPTKAHEYLFLLSKRERYYYDAESIREQATDTGRKNGRDGREEAPEARPPGSNPRTLKRLDYTAPRKVKVPGGWDRGAGAHGTIHRDGRTSAEYQEVVILGGRNRRSVWTIAMQPYAAAHFATFPEALVEPCILAGSRPGDIVLDPFIGSGTVARVAERFGRKWFGCELNPAYMPLQHDRTRVTAGLAL